MSDRNSAHHGWRGERARIVIVSVWLLLLVGPSVAVGAVIVRPIEPPERFDGGPLLVQFRSGGVLQSPTRGLGVFTANGEPVPFRLLGHEAEGVTSLAIDMPTDTARVHLHYSGRTVRDARTDPDLPLSMVMRTYPLRTTGLRSARDIQRAIENANPFGVALVDRIHFAHNPFGPDRQFITDIQGLIQLDDTTTFRLFSNHNHIAFVLINGQTVIAGDEPNTQRDFHALDEQAIEITLDPGTHQLRYLHVAEDEPPQMALGMMEARRARPVPAHYFVRHPRGTLGPATITGDEPARPVIGFDAEQREQMGHEDHVFTRYALRPLAPPPEGMRYRWDFGDTTTAERADAERFDHVFPGPPEALPAAADERGWRVRLELVDDRGRSVAQATSRLRPVVFSHTEHAGNERLLRRYAEAIADADYQRTPAEVLLAFYELLAETEQPALIAPIAAPFVERFGNRRDETAWQLKHALATHLAADDPARAAALFNELAQSASDSWRAATAAAEQLDLLIFRLNYADGAEGMERIRRTVARMYANRGPRERALIWTRMGDAHRAAGRYDEAAEAYREAQRRRGREIDAPQAAVMRRAYRETALSYLNQRRYPALRNELLQWEADFPTAKLEGDLLLLAGRYFAAIGDDARAAVEYRTLLEMNPLHPRRPELAFRLGVTLQRMGEADEARPWLEEVAERYPNSPFAREAQGRLR